MVFREAAESPAEGPWPARRCSGVGIGVDRLLLDRGSDEEGRHSALNTSARAARRRAVHADAVRGMS
jgi:hypothetical protein